MCILDLNSILQTQMKYWRNADSLTQNPTESQQRSSERTEAIQNQDKVDKLRIFNLVSPFVLPVKHESEQRQVGLKRLKVSFKQRRQSPKGNL